MTKSTADRDSKTPDSPPKDGDAKPTAKDGSKDKGGEIGGPKGPEPTRFGDWEQKGRCSDF